MRYLKQSDYKKSYNKGGRCLSQNISQWKAKFLQSKSMIHNTTTGKIDSLLGMDIVFLKHKKCPEMGLRCFVIYRYWGTYTNIWNQVVPLSIGMHFNTWDSRVNFCKCFNLLQTIQLIPKGLKKYARICMHFHLQWICDAADVLIWMMVIYFPSIRHVVVADLATLGILLHFLPGRLGWPPREWEITTWWTTVHWCEDT